MSIFPLRFDIHRFLGYLLENRFQWSSKIFIVQYGLHHPLYLPSRCCFFFNFPEEVVFELDVIQLLFERLVDEALLHGLYSFFRPFQSGMEFVVDQGGQGVFDQSNDARNSILQCLLTHGYLPFSAHRSLFLGQVLL